MTESNVPPPPQTAPPTDTPALGYQAMAVTKGPPYIGPAPDQNAKTMGMLCHILALSGFIIPFGSILGPLIMWLIKKAEHPFIDDQGKESLNFSITFLLAVIVAVLTMFVLIGFILLPAVVITWIVFVIIATTKANQGIPYRYPFNIRFIK